MNTSERLFNMKKIAFFTILLLIICYGIFSNYKSKIDKSSSSFLSPQNNLESPSKTKEEFGCINEGGIIKSSYCRFSKTKCKEYFLSENFDFLTSEEVVHCTSYKVGVDGEGYDIVMKIMSEKKEKNSKFKKIESKKVRPSEIKGFILGEGLCIKPKDKFHKIGIHSDSLRDLICSIVKNDEEVSLNQFQINEKKINFFYLDERTIWINSPGF